MVEPGFDERVDLAFRLVSARERRKLLEAVTALGACSFERLSQVDGGAQPTVIKRIHQLCEAELIMDDGRKGLDRYRLGPTMPRVTRWVAGLPKRDVAPSRSSLPLQPLLAGLRSTSNRLVIEQLAKEGALTNQHVAQLTGLSQPTASRATQQMVQSGLIAKRRDGYYVVLKLRRDSIARLWDWVRDPPRDRECAFSA